MKKKFISLKGLEKIKKEQLKQIKGGKKAPTYALYNSHTTDDPE